MGFEKGKSGNPAGRKPGTANVATHAVWDRFAQLLNGYSLEQMQADLEAIGDPRDRLNIILGLAEFVAPKLIHNDLRASIKEAAATFDITPVSKRPLPARQSDGK